MSQWGSYADALSGAKLYVVRMNVTTGNWEVKQGAADTIAARCSTVVATQYLWCRVTRAQTCSLLWIAEPEPFSPGVGWSGSVLCLGKPTDKSAKAVVFQNYEDVYRCSVNSLTGQSTDIIVKGGFLLPLEIRCSQIVSSEEEHRRKIPNSFPRVRRGSCQPERRVFSAM